MRRCEYIERKTPSKNILKFLKHFSSRSHPKLFFGTTLYIDITYHKNLKIIVEIKNKKFDVVKMTFPIIKFLNLVKQILDKNLIFVVVVFSLGKQINLNIV